MASKVATPNEQQNRHNKSRASNSTKKGLGVDMWQENMHFTNVYDDPEDPVRLAANMKHVNDHDKFVEYIRHVESKLLFHLFDTVLVLYLDAKRLKLES